MEVTAGIIQKDGKILICQRPEGKASPAFGNSPAASRSQENHWNRA